MTSAELIHYLQSHDVELWVDQDQLRYRGADDVVTDEIVSELRAHKAEIVAQLQARPEPVARPTPVATATNDTAAVLVGASGLKVSPLGLGPYSSTMVSPGSEGVFDAVLNTYVDLGGNYIDVSDVYTGAEERLGSWLSTRSDRDALVIATKSGFQVGPGANDIGLSRKHLMTSIDTSLRRLGIDHVDVYYAHIWDGATPLEETIGVLTDIVTAGKARYIGVSNYTGWQIQKAVDLTDRIGRRDLICIQTQYNLLDRYPEWEQLPVCSNEGLGVFAWGSLSGGWLTGKYRRGMSPADVGERVGFEGILGMSHNSFEFKNTERTWRTIDALIEVADELGKTPGQVALRWLRSRPGVIPILGPRNVAQLEEGFGSIGWTLSDEHLSRLEDASALPPIMPHMMVQSQNPPDRW